MYTVLPFFFKKMEAVAGEGNYFSNRIISSISLVVWSNMYEEERRFIHQILIKPPD